MRRCARVLLPLLVAACSGTGQPAPEVTFERLSLGSVCYGECAYQLPYALPHTTVYGDGRLVTADVRSGRTFSVTLREGRVAPSVVAELAALAARAGLPDDGTRAGFREERGFADGGGAVLGGRSGDSTFLVEAPYLYGSGDEPTYGRSTRRTALFRLKQALEAAGRSATTPLVPARAALVARALPTGTRDAPAWRGAPLAALPPAGEGTRCAVLTGAALADAESAAEYGGFSTEVTDGRRRWSVRLRPLLPHEQGCADLPLD